MLAGPVQIIFFLAQKYSSILLNFLLNDPFFIRQDKQPRWVWVENQALRNPHQDEAQRVLPRIHQRANCGRENIDGYRLVCVSLVERACDSGEDKKY